MSTQNLVLNAILAEADNHTLERVACRRFCKIIGPIAGIQLSPHILQSTPGFSSCGSTIYLPILWIRYKGQLSILRQFLLIRDVALSLLLVA